MKRQAGFIYSDKIKSLEYSKNESVELFLTYCGYKNCDAGYQSSPDIKNYYILCIITEGKGICEIDDKVYYMQKGDAVLLFPGMDGRFKADLQDPWSYAWIGFAGMKADECAMYSGFSQKTLIQSIENIEDLDFLIKQILEVQDNSFSNELRRNGLLKLFFANLIEQYDRQRSEIQARTSYNRETSMHIKNAISYIAENYTSNIKINELADHIGVNRSYLASSFKKVTGYSPKEYLLHLRMEKAKSLLEKTDLPINSIANAVGYTDQLAFSRMFKRYSGISPKLYREENKV